MVFSFFNKKSTDKADVRMPPLQGAPIVSAVVSRPPAQAVPPAQVPAVEDGLDTTINTCYGIEVFEETDPYSEIAEHAAILFANGQYEVARSTLESVVQNNADQGVVKLWLMLFDLLRIRNDRNAFDALGLDFASICELSPPSWKEGAESTSSKSKEKPQTAAGVVILQGAVTGSDAAFDELLQALSKGEPRTLDMGRLAGIDSEASGRLAKILHQARHRDLAWGLGSGTETLAKRFSARLIAGQTRDENMWLLVLELFQFLGQEALFEEKAVDYAITFEVSPPAWEPPRAKPAVKEEEKEPSLSEVLLDAPMTSSLEGEILQGRLDAIACQLIPGEECRLDFSLVQRMDFVSAGALATLLKEANCKQITIVQPNRMVAELLRVMGIDKIASIELAKY
ncbi:MAG: STAS domain-containing protein [Zoogloeaceae bacterium]|jgi:anti-anti-sigma regulatory factor|nr:STAS domain-containing protein [Zoogloeaceae bacterium]